MTFNPTLLVPYGYGTTRKTLAEVDRWLRAHHHPEYVRRLVAWLNGQGGKIGPGGGWRPIGTQPDRKGFAPEGKSFHQDQTYNDGFVGACAVDLVVVNGSSVHRSPRWDEVPAQGSGLSTAWGLHCNVSSEAWHIQPIEIDGWWTWRWINGRRAPRANYPLPIDVSPDLTPPPDTTQWPTPPGSPSFVAGSTDISTTLPGWPTGRVTYLQTIIGVWPTTGIWDFASRAKMRQLQGIGGLQQDGLYGPRTAAKFYEWRGR